MADQDNQADDALEAILDMLVYAPIGLLLDAKTVQPDLAERGRMHAKVARQIGEIAVTAGWGKIDDVLNRISNDMGARAKAAPAKQEPAAKKSATKSAVVEKNPAASPSKNKPAKKKAPKKTSASKKSTKKKSTKKKPTSKKKALAIPDYDTLAASQVVKRLGSLSASELTAVRKHEESNRGRRTILTKIARLEGNE